MKLILLTLFLVMMGCNTSKQAQKAKYFVYLNGHRKKLEVEIPKGVIHAVSTDDLFEIGQQIKYWYRDSALLYLVDGSHMPTPNYDNIHNQPNGMSNQIIYDTVVLQGSDKNGKYWKEIKLQSTRIGYSKIPKERKSDFDKAVDSWTVK